MTGATGEPRGNQGLALGVNLQNDTLNSEVSVEVEENVRKAGGGVYSISLHFAEQEQPLQTHTSWYLYRLPFIFYSFRQPNPQTLP